MPDTRRVVREAEAHGPLNPKLLERIDGVPRLMAVLLYGAGLRLLEGCRLRIQDVRLGGVPSRDRRTRGWSGPARRGLLGVAVQHTEGSRCTLISRTTSRFRDAANEEGPWQTR
jgi:hypothetical protein